jgi:hypothetical protein
MTARPNEQSKTPSTWQLIGLGFALWIAGLATHALIGSVLSNPARYAAVALFGILVGMTELISRYRDKPTAPLGTVPGLIYIATNAIASIAALWVLQRQNVNFDFGGKLPPELGQVLLAGFGTMFLFRSALFVVRVGDSDVAIGPAAVLQIILNAADRACDRLRAGPRSEHVYKIMRGVSFERARIALPLHCLGLMQNVSIAEQTQLMQTIDALASKSMSDEVKAYNLGLLMMNVVGEDVLERAVGVLGPLILGPATDEPPILAQAATLSTDETLALVHVCVALDPLARTDQSAAQIAEALTALIEPIKQQQVKNVVALMRLRERFGPTTISRALALLTAGRPVGTPVAGPLTAADLLKPGAGGPVAPTGAAATENPASGAALHGGAVAAADDSPGDAAATAETPGPEPDPGEAHPPPDENPGGSR